MYNRYVRGDDGTYTRVAEEEPRRAEAPPAGAPPPPAGEASGGAKTPPPPPPPPSGDGFGGFGGGFAGAAEGLGGYFRRLLDQLHLDRIDTGDLLLLGLLYFLFREKADEELLIALGLLLIL